MVVVGFPCTDRCVLNRKVNDKNSREELMERRAQNHNALLNRMASLHRQADAGRYFRAPMALPRAPFRRQPGQEARALGEQQRPACQKDPKSAWRESSRVPCRGVPNTQITGVPTRANPICLSMREPWIAGGLPRVVRRHVTRWYR